MNNYIDFGSSMESNDKVGINEPDGDQKDLKQKIDQESESARDKTKLQVTVEHHSMNNQDGDLIDIAQTDQVSENTVFSLADDKTDDKNDNEASTSHGDNNTDDNIVNDNEVKKGPS